MRANKNSFLTIIIVLLLITTIASIGWYFSRSQSRALAANNGAVPPPAQNQQAPAVKPTALATQPTTPAASIFPLSQTVNGMTVQVTAAKLIKTGIEIDICYPTPDAGEWYSTPGHLYYSTWEILPDEAGLISEKKADGVNPGQNCELILYKIDDQASITLPIKFSLLGIHVVPREGPACKDLQVRLDSNAKAKAYGLKVNCAEGGQNSGRTATLADHGKSVSDAVAQKALDEILQFSIDGPWEFSITQLDK
ncbi:MAG: hypothetical protein WA821_09330 [Anaerolineales bacterium]